MDLIYLNARSRVPLYMQLYSHFKREIENSRLPEGEKLPSIRELSKNLSVSKITVEKAYQQLMSEGYIENKDRSRYMVNRVESPKFTRLYDRQEEQPQSKGDGETHVAYDFSSGEMDVRGFDFSLWKRYVSKVFLEKERLVGYGDVQGEAELRSEIALYIQKSRGVYASKEQIIVGPGVQSLLNILCSLLKAEYDEIAFEEPGFRNGRRVFADHNFQILPIPMNKNGMDMDKLEQSGSRLVYVSPSHQFPTGYVMPIAKRNRLMTWAQTVGGTIVEDDYDSEFRYYGRPIPALKGLDTRGHVVYLGSFSKVIPPSIRLSYMVLPERLLALYKKNAALYNQAASKLEQLALANFMADGHLERQIRRLRKLYQEKRRIFLATIASTFADRVTVNNTDTGLHIILSVQTDSTADELAARALATGCRIAPIQDYYLGVATEKQPRIILFFSRIPVETMKSALALLKKAWFTEETPDSDCRINAESDKNSLL